MFRDEPVCVRVQAPTFAEIQWNRGVDGAELVDRGGVPCLKGYVRGWVWFVENFDAD